MHAFILELLKFHGRMNISLLIHTGKYIPIGTVVMVVDNMRSKCLSIRKKKVQFFQGFDSSPVIAIGHDDKHDFLLNKQ